jgi:hypothetical protein
MAAIRPAQEWERYAWIAGIVYVVFLVIEAIISVGVHANQNDSAAKIARELFVHRDRAVVVACLSVIYAAAFLIYLTRLHDLFRRHSDRPAFLNSWVFAGGVLFVTLHSVSDVGITGMLGAKVASYSAHHDVGLSYTLYLLTFALDSVGDLFASLLAFAAAMIIVRSQVLPRWLGWLLIPVSILFFLQTFGLGGVISTFGLVLDLIGFLLFLLFVLASSAILLRRDPDAGPARRIAGQPLT